MLSATDSVLEHVEYREFACPPNNEQAAAELTSTAALFHPVLHFRWCTGLQAVVVFYDHGSKRAP